jgi:hypothetical protein
VEQALVISNSRMRAPALAIAVMLLGAGVRLLLTHPDLLGATIAQAAIADRHQPARLADTDIPDAPEFRLPADQMPVIVHAQRIEPRLGPAAARATESRNEASTMNGMNGPVSGTGGGRAAWPGPSSSDWAEYWTIPCTAG